MDKKTDWIIEMINKVANGDITRDQIEVIPIDVSEGGNCGQYVACDVSETKHPAECRYTIISENEWRKDMHSKEITDFLKENHFLNENQTYVIHRLGEVLERIYEVQSQKKWYV